MSDVEAPNPPVHLAWHSWLDHPWITRHYGERGLVDGLRWEEWVFARLGGPLERSLHLGCGDGYRSLYLYQNNLARIVDGVDPSEEQVARAEANRSLAFAPGLFRVADLNSARLPFETYDLVFVSHCLHRVVALEHLLDQVYTSLTARGVFVLEGYAGPSRFQWTEAQMALVEAALASLPERLRMFRWSIPKRYEGRSERAAVRKASPFEAIRSGEIDGLFRQRFEVLKERRLGGTIQSLLYNGIMHNFPDGDPVSTRCLETVARLEDVLVDTGLLPSDYVLMIGCRR
jgi:SAM-dependent methyltransferase